MQTDCSCASGYVHTTEGTIDAWMAAGTSTLCCRHGAASCRRRERLGALELLQRRTSTRPPAAAYSCLQLPTAPDSSLQLPTAARRVPGRRRGRCPSKLAPAFGTDHNTQHTIHNTAQPNHPRPVLLASLLRLKHHLLRLHLVEQLVALDCLR